jgi:DNA-binding IclR family transcriptional regulator
MQDDRTGDARPGGVQAIARAARVLRALEVAPGGLGIGELAASVGLPKSTVHRLVQALAAEDLVSTSGGRVHLGAALARLGAATYGALASTLRPALETLRSDLDETADLAVLDGAGVRFIDQLAAPHRLRAVSAVGSSFPLHCTANGKALLAALDDERARDLLPARLERFTPMTITSRDDLIAQLAEVRSSGVAYDREEHTEGICAVAAVVRDMGGPVAAISVPVPTQRFSGREPRYAEAVLKAAAAGSRLLTTAG